MNGKRRDLTPGPAGPVRKRLLGLIGLAMMAACMGCKKTPAADESTINSGRSVLKLNDQLHLALGSFELEEVPFDKAELRTKFPNPPSPVLGSATFSFFVPGESRLKYPDRYSKLDPRHGLDENVVNVLRFKAWTSQQVLESPVTARDAQIAWQEKFRPRLQMGAKPQEILGMQCFVDPDLKSRDCIAVRPSGEYARFDIDEENSSFPHPTLKARYFTKAYGGIEVRWHAHIKHAATWKEIDEKLWRLIERWNVAPVSN